jgi:hypothetical protein
MMTAVSPAVTGVKVGLRLLGRAASSRLCELRRCGGAYLRDPGQAAGSPIPARGGIMIDLFSESVGAQHAFR